MLKITVKSMLTVLRFGLVFQYMSFAHPASASAISFTPQPNSNGGAIIGRIPISKLGSIVIPRGRAYFKTNMVEITGIAEYQFDRQQLLSGPILKAWTTSDSKNVYVQGIAYFQDGDWIKYVNENAPDAVVGPSGTFKGQITAMKNGALDITGDDGVVTRVPISEVQQIISPRAYAFKIPVLAALRVPATEPLSGEAAGVALAPTSRVFLSRSLKQDPIMQGDGDMSNAKLTSLWSGISAVQIAQFIPLAILEGPVRRQLVSQYHSRIGAAQQDANLPTMFGTLYQNSPNAPGANPYLGSFGLH